MNIGIILSYGNYRYREVLKNYIKLDILNFTPFQVSVALNTMAWLAVGV